MPGEQQKEPKDEKIPHSVFYNAFIYGFRNRNRLLACRIGGCSEICFCRNRQIFYFAA